MSIAGKAEILITPYHDVNHDGTAKADELKRIWAKLNDRLPIPKMGLKGDIVACDAAMNPYLKDRPGRKALSLYVPDNLNFWAQLVLVPTLLTPYFWKKTAKELTAERARLTAGGAWARENWLRLAERFDGSIFVHESYDYDGFAEHVYSASAKWSEDDPTGNMFAVEPPDYAAALEHQMDMVKGLAAKLRSGQHHGPNGEKVVNVQINKDQYWGMFV